MSSTRFSDTLKDVLMGWLPIPAPSRLEVELSQLDPDKFYIENVRHVLGVTHSHAVRICDTAVRQRIFLKGTEILAPNYAVAKTVQYGEPLPDRVICILETEDGYEEEEFATSDLEKRTFYRLAAS